RPRFACAQPAQRVDASRLRAPLDLVEPRALRIAGRDDQLAADAVPYAVTTAELDQLAPSFDAQPRLQRARLVVDPRVDHFAVARTGHRAERVLPLQHHDLAARPRELARNRQADNPRADNDRLHSVHR